MRSPDPLWFPRFGDIPGVSYTTPADLDLGRLRHRHARPTVYRYPDMPPSLFWGDTSQAPARSLALGDPRSATTGRALRNLAEALELPGEPSDYHFAIQGVVDLLWSRRAAEPAVFGELERLCWLDAQLIDALPDTIRYKPLPDSIRPEHRDGSQQYFRVTTFERLLTLYLTEGALADAVRVLDIAERRGNGNTASAGRVRDQWAAFAAEDAGR